MLKPSLRRARGVVALAVALGCLFIAAPSAGAAVEPAGTTWLPPAYLMWRTGGLPSGLTPKLDALQGTDDVVVVAADTLWMKRSVRADGAVVDHPRSPYRIPIEVMATSVHDLDPFLPPAWRDTVLDALRDGLGVIGTSSAELRRLHVGDRFVFAKGHITVGAIVPDDVVAWSEVMVSRDVGRPLGVRHDRFALLRMQGKPSGGATWRTGSRRCWGRATGRGFADLVTPRSAVRATRSGRRS